jgi:hypothetical protein
VWGDRYTTDIDIQKNQAEIIVPNKARFEAGGRRDARAHCGRRERAAEACLSDLGSASADLWRTLSVRSPVSRA